MSSSDSEALAYLAQVGPLVDAELERLLPPPDEEPARLHEAMRYAVFPGGKRFRPALLLACCEALGGERKAALPAAAAVELVHSYSLVHDDLPCLDDDAVRRGRPSCHAAYGEALALLAGDALLTLAFLAASEGPPGTVALLAEAAGSRGMVGGQVADMAAPNRPSERELEFIHERKTGALFGFCGAAGALAAGAPGAVVEKMRLFGLRLGRAFQLADDAMDWAETDEPNAAAVWGREETLARARREADAARALIAGFGERARLLVSMLGLAVSRTS